MIKIEKNICNLKVNYIKKGSGKNVLIIPGWGTTINVYNTLISSISEYANVYCLDMPGFGNTSEPSTPWGLNEYVDFIIKFIESEKIDKLDVIGHSNGGRIIIRMMNKANLNFKVEKIILIGSAGIVHKKTFKQKVQIRTFKIGKKVLNLKLVKKVFPNSLENFKKKFGSDDYKNASPIMRSSMVKLINEDLKEELPNIKVPTLLLWGKMDDATPLEDGKIMESLIPDAGLVSFDGCSHDVFLERVAHVNAVIKNFLTGGK